MNVTSSAPAQVFNDLSPVLLSVSIPHQRWGFTLKKLRDGLCDYIIVHELLHLKVRNHGKLFKSLMHAYLPGWEELERKLKVSRIPVAFLVQNNINKSP